MRYFPGYVLNDELCFRPGCSTPVVNLAKLKEILKSTDLSRNAELEWASAKNLRFLDYSDTTGDHISFQSLPRSGNSFLRRVIEIITGVYSGGDMRIRLTLHLCFGGNMAGEETVPQDKLTWITKTHWPMESPAGAIKFSSNKCFSIIRNPIDMIPSIALLMNTTSHSLTTT